MDALIKTRLPELRRKRSLNRSQLSRLTVREGFAGVPEGTIKSIEKAPGRVPDLAFLQAIAGPLGVEPSYFYEYPIALARASAARESTDGGTVPIAQGAKAALRRQLREKDSQRSAEQAGQTPKTPRTRRPQRKAP